jgi:hypothetical protein
MRSGGPAGRGAHGEFTVRRVIRMSAIRPGRRALIRPRHRINTTAVPITGNATGHKRVARSHTASAHVPAGLHRISLVGSWLAHASAARPSSSLGLIPSYRNRLDRCGRPSNDRVRSLPRSSFDRPACGGHGSSVSLLLSPPGRARTHQRVALLGHELGHFVNGDARTAVPGCRGCTSSRYVTMPRFSLRIRPAACGPG